MDNITETTTTETTTNEELKSWQMNGHAKPGRKPGQKNGEGKTTTKKAENMPVSLDENGFIEVKSAVKNVRYFQLSGDNWLASINEPLSAVEIGEIHSEMKRLPELPTRSWGYVKEWMSISGVDIKDENWVNYIMNK